MKITIRYFDGCPNWMVARDRVRQAIAELGISETTAIELEAVETPAVAERLRFRGSPTVLVDGIDPFSDDSAPVGLSCRVYRTESGFEGAPSLGQLRAALARNP